MSKALTPYRENDGSIMVSPQKPIEVPHVSEKLSLLDSIKASRNGDTIDPEMHEKRFQMIQEDIIESMDHIIQRCAQGQSDMYYFKLPYLRSELVDGDIRCTNARNEYKRLTTRIQRSFEEKGWYMYLDLTNAVFQPWDFWFWKPVRQVTLWTTITLKPLL